jgi:hypothetical protein
MRKLAKLAVVAAMIGGAGFAGTGVAFADSPAQYDAPMGALMGGGPDIDVSQHVACKSHDTNIGVLSNLSVLNGSVLSGLLGQEGNNGESNQNQGSRMACGAAAFTG